MTPAMPQGPSARSEMEIELSKLSSPRIFLAFRQVIRLYPEVSWVNNFRIADPGLAIERRPTLLAPMAAILGGERTGRMTISQQTMRHLLDSIATRLDEARDISRYMT